MTDINGVPKAEDDFAKGAFSMISYLLRASRPHGFRYVCGLSEDRKYESAFELLKHFSEIYGMEGVDISGLAMEMSQLSLDVQNPYSLVGDILPADLFDKQK